MFKYLSTVKIALLNSFAYKYKLLFYALTGIIQFIVYFFLWKTIFLSAHNYNGFTLESVITYFVLSFVIQSILPKWIAMEIGWSVKKGEISTKLLKPICFKKYFLFYSLGDVIFTFIFMGAPIILTSFFSNAIVSCNNAILFMITLIISYLITFYLYYIIGLLSFWFINIWGIFITFDFIYLFLSGAYLPIAFMPDTMKIIIGVLPFKYIVDFPISIWINNTVDIKSLCIQFLWLLILFLISEIMYKKAINKLEVLGG